MYYSSEQLSRGTRYIQNGRLDKAIEVLSREVRRKESKEALLNLGAAYMMTGSMQKARACFDKIDSAKFYNGKTGVYVEEYLNRGLLEYSIGDDSSAIDVYRDGLEQVFDYNLAWNYSIARLRQYCSGKYSDLAFCWQMYESRFKIADAVRLSSQVNWTGGVRVDSVTVLAEQGVGDNIMFGRYLPEVSKWCDRLVVQCEESANAIFAGYSVSNSNIIDTSHCISMCSLGNLLDHIPSGVWIPGYSKSPTGRLQIGCVWQSNNKHANNAWRNSSIEPFLELKNIGDCYSLGPDCIDPRMQHLPSADWGDTIKHLNSLDMVVTIDSAIANLCGSMGVPCYVLQPRFNSDWRWGDNSMGDKTIWYDSIKVVRWDQSWDKMIRTVIECLK